MFESVKVSPSILSADFMNLESSIRMIEKGGAGYVHVDVMDGHFVPNITIGIPLVQQLKKITDLPLDVHLMVSNPLVQIPWFLDAGADMLTVHIEALNEEGGEVKRAIELIHFGGARAAFALKPDTPVSALGSALQDLDMVLVMSVYPGFSGQSYIEGTEDKIEELVAMAQARGVCPLIEVDGGIDVSTVGRVAAVGADVFVAGNAVFKAPRPEKAIALITAAAREARL